MAAAAPASSSSSSSSSYTYHHPAGCRIFFRVFDPDQPMTWLYENEKATERLIVESETPIGAGVFGKVYEVSTPDGKTPYVLKTFEPSDAEFDPANEIRALARVGLLYGCVPVYRNPHKKPAIIMHKVGDRNLEDFFRAHAGTHTRDKRFFTHHLPLHQSAQSVSW